MLENNLGFLDFVKYKLDNANANHTFAQLNGMLQNQEIDIRRSSEGSETNESEDENDNNKGNCCKNIPTKINTPINIRITK